MLSVRGASADASWDGIGRVDAPLPRWLPPITLYTTGWCGYCSRAKLLLERRGLPYREVSLDGDPAFRQRVFDLGGRWTVPLVVIGAEVVGGYDELAALDRSGALDRLLAA